VATEVGFYHLTRRPLDAVLPRLLEKVLEAGHRVVLRSGDRARLEALDALLWTYDEGSFLPHALDPASVAAEQPVLLTSGEGAPNGATVLALIDGALPDDIAGFERVLYLFEADDPERLALARGQWSALKDRDGVTRTYWQQNERGRWERKQ
jgi:DNA polymerase-3 subunit chi